jgi:S-formylglutathione hydrolase
MGQWRQTQIDGKTADVFEPAESCGRAVIHLHGHGLATLKDNPAFSAEFERWGLPVICPHGQRSWWLDVVCAEFDARRTPLDFVRDRIVSWVAERWDCRPPQIGLTGISMGGQGVLQLAYRQPRQFPVVAAISPAVDFHNWHGQGLPLDEMFDSPEAARQETATLQLHPLNWPAHQLLVCDPQDTDWFEGVDRLSMKLSSSGILFESDLETCAGGHSWDYFDQMAPKVVEFVAQRLARVAGSS